MVKTEETFIFSLVSCEMHTNAQITTSQATHPAFLQCTKNLLSFWNTKAAGFVGYGSMGGARAIENLRLIKGELQVADVRSTIYLLLFADRG